MNRTLGHLLLFVCLLCCLVQLGCDSDISGTPLENQPPDTELSVRDTSLVDNLNEENRLISTVFASWSGDDADGFVQSFEFRFFDENDLLMPEEGWTATLANDTLILLPIERGSKTANVAFEVRAIDNEGIKDPTPARTVFPIQNSPPNIRISSFDLPPDTTFGIISFAWRADDPDGPENITRIDISLNDSTSFVSLPPDVDFITLSANNMGRDQAAGTTIESEVFFGRGLVSSGITVPGLMLESDNTFYVRSVDATDTTSTIERFEWYVKKSNSNILFVNDFRKASNPTIQSFHVNLLQEYLPAGTDLDTWKIAEPFVTGNTGNAPRSDALPPNASPTLQSFFNAYDYIYWVTTASTNSVQGNNLPLAASVMDGFFDQGGKLMVHSPITLPNDPETNLNNPAVAILPVNELVLLPDSLRRLSLPTGSTLTPLNEVPGTGQVPPELTVQQFIIGALPFVADGASTVPLYDGMYRYVALNSNQGDWPGPSSVASISADQRIGIFTIPMVNEQTGAPSLTDANGDGEAAKTAVKLMLESLGFPKR
ncbi:MAG: hypothetical protein AAF564_11855 [Bacteroidota bacterium]